MIIFLVLFLWVVINYFSIRLFWLKRMQQTVLLRSPIIYMSLPPLKTMMWKKFWVWNDLTFLPHPEDLVRE